MAKYDTAKFIGGFGEALLKVLQDAKKTQQETEMFNRKLAEDRRQFDLNLRFQKQRDELDKQLKERNLNIDKQVKEYNISKEYQPFIPSPIMPTAPEGFTSGAQLNKQFEGVLNPFDPTRYYIKPVEPPETLELKPMYGGLAKIKKSGENIKDINWLISPKNQNGSEGNKNDNKTPTFDEKPRDISDYLRDAVQQFETYKRVATGEQDFYQSGSKIDQDKAKKIAFGDLKAKTDGLLAKADMETDKKIYWDTINEGGDLWEAINNINSFRSKYGHPPLPDWKIELLDYYDRMRNSKRYNSEENSENIFDKITNPIRKIF